jgi:ABC-type lipoprotein export system ATPase subunit
MNIFEIEALSCQYKPDTPVLRIQQLHIPRGELIFIVGVSGVGKSTFIETLGLMNNTIVPDTTTQIKFMDSSGVVNELSGVWSQPPTVAADFRKKHFSFIFQQTNLMPNFTVGENLAIGMLIQNRKMEEIKPRILSLMEVFHLPTHIFDSKVYELSGGQRQRLAFLRAVTSNFEVLFGDEPTGNLDQKTAHTLMRYLVSLLKQEKKTGLIVSHDQQLAFEFADRIIIITPQRTDSEQIFGLITETEQLIRKANNQWETGNHKIVTDPKTWLSQKIAHSA